MPTAILSETIHKALSFDDYLALTERILNDPEPDSVYQNEKTLRYTHSNLSRMRKVLQTTILHQKLYNLLSSLTEKWIWLVISEPWCGDASWGTPTLYLISQASENIGFRILLRDEYPEIMKAYQTAGSDSIPKLICLRTSDLKELGTWGPRPLVLQQMVTAWKDAPLIDYRENVRALHAWYEEDKGTQIQEEITELVKKWKDSI